MEKGFCLGMALGVLAGAVIVANSLKARQLVKDGQEQIKNKVSEMTSKKKSKKSKEQGE